MKGGEIMRKPIPCPQEEGEPCTNPDCSMDLCQLEQTEKRERAAAAAKMRDMEEREKEELARVVLKRKGLPETWENIEELKRNEIIIKLAREATTK
jgi:hypothetical protein